MEQKSLLDYVRSTLLKRGDEFEWITAPTNPAEKTGIAYVQFGAQVPCSFLFMEIADPQTLILDVLFAARVPQERYLEVSLLLQKLNATQTRGSFLLDMDAGYVYFRQSSLIEGIQLGNEQIENLIANLERVGLATIDKYAEVIATEFPI